MLTNDKQDLFNKAKEIVSNEDIYFIDDMIASLPCGKSKFYELFPAQSEEMEELKGFIENNKIAKKKKLRKNWESDKAHATLQLALMKLLSTPEELKKLSMNHTDVTSDGKPLQPQPVTYSLTLPNDSD